MVKKQDSIDEILVRVADMEKKTDSFLSVANILREYYESGNGNKSGKDQEAFLERTITYMSELKRKIIEVISIIENA